MRDGGGKFRPIHSDDWKETGQENQMSVTGHAVVLFIAFPSVPLPSCMHIYRNKRHVTQRYIIFVENYRAIVRFEIFFETGFHFILFLNIYIYSYNKSRNIALRWQCSVFHSEFIGSRVINNVYTSFPRLIRKNWRELRIFPYLLFPEIFLDRYPSRSSNSAELS